MEKTIKIPSTIESLREVEKLLDEFSTNCKLNNVVYGNVLVAALEGVNNAIVHGNKLDSNKYVVFNIRCDEQSIALKIKDQGAGFDFTHVPDPTAPENIENISGRGVFLMQKLSDQLIFSDNGATVEIIFKIK